MLVAHAASDAARTLGLHCFRAPDVSLLGSRAFLHDEKFKICMLEEHALSMQQEGMRACMGMLLCSWMP